MPIQLTGVQMKGFPFPVLFLSLPYSVFAIQLSLVMLQAKEEYIPCKKHAWHVLLMVKEAK